VPEEDLTKKKCIPCEGGVDSLTESEVASYIERVSGWKLFEGAHSIKKEFRFKDFKEAMTFANKVATIAEEEDHHPDIHILYNLVWLELSTHAISGLSENDFILAAKIDENTAFG